MLLCMLPTLSQYWNIFDSMLAVESALSIVTRLQSARFSCLDCSQNRMGLSERVEKGSKRRSYA